MAQIYAAITKISVAALYVLDEETLLYSEGIILIRIAGYSS